MKSNPETERGVTAPDGTTKARIERAALRLFAERGIDAVTTREIAGAAGISEGALYRHFSGKEDLGETLFFAIHARLADLIGDAGRRHASIDAQAGAIVQGYCRTADEDWALFCYHLLATHRFLPSAAALRAGEKNPVAAVEAIVEAAMKRGELNRGNAPLVAAMALGVVLQTALHKAYGRIAGDLAPHSAELTSAVISVLRSEKL